MSSIKQRAGTALAVRTLDYVRRDPGKRLLNLVEWAERIDVAKRYKNLIMALKEIARDENNNWNRMIRAIFDEIAPEALEKFITAFVLNSAFFGNEGKDERKAKEGCNIPWAILMDPTAACNLRCIGCWAADYQKSASMDEALLDRIITEGKALGIYMYIYSGGEPLVRKDDLLRLAARHPDCYFLSFTNATLVDEAFAKEARRVGNLAFAISVEGFEDETDMRRGAGTYRRVMAAMDRLKRNGVPFGFSTCYHRLNTEVVGSEAYIDLMVEKGCRFGWYFTYMPLGKDARTELIATPDQREFMYHRVREMRDTKPIFVLDFWNDGEYVHGCIAGGQSYLHINAAGDVEPCAFIHYSNVNIRDTSLLEALKSPIFEEYKRGQPFNENHLRPCPLLDNPEKLREMVRRSGARSTQPLDEEDVASLTAKCEEPARAWAARADELWEARSRAAPSGSAPAPDGLPPRDLVRVGE
jgi:MoaA/NifB/PqqE/SkfB family radical SAM enzyme